MPGLMQIDEPPQGELSAPSWSAFLELGFRPLYLAGCVWALVSVLLWIFMPEILMGKLAGMFWHMHEMLWGFVATIAVGFLVTAGANWTGINPISGKPLAALLAAWLIARIGFLLPSEGAFAIAAMAELLFFSLAAVAMGYAVFTARSKRNYGVPFLMLGLGLSDSLFLWAAHTGEYTLLLSRFYAGMLCMALIALLIARRVIPFFATRAIPGLTIPMHLESGRVQVTIGGLAIVFLLVGWSVGVAVALFLAGLISLWQVLSWKPWAVRKVPLLWVLYIGYSGLGMGLIVAAVEASGVSMPPALPVHLIGVGGFSVLIIGMVTRTALGHLGRPLRTDKSMVTAYGLVIAAAVLRLLALLPVSFAYHFLYCSALLWGLAFALYIWRFFPWMIRHRADRIPAVRSTMPTWSGKKS